MSTGIGDTLREAREAQGRTLEDAAGSVRARVGQLQALEEERFDSFGGEVYAKGFLKSYALELGLDPEPLMATFRQEVSELNEGATASMVKPVKTPGPRGTTPPAWLAWAMVAVVVVAGLGFLGLISGGTPETAEEGPIGSPVAPAPSEDPEGEANPGDEPGDEPADEEPVAEEPEPVEEEVVEEPEFEGVEVIFALERASWMRVTLDGAVIREETVPAGETLRYEGDEVVVRFGDAGGVRIQYNGEDLGAAGGRGEVVDLRFTPDGVEDA